jgi:hypothetical protein
MSARATSNTSTTKHTGTTVAQPAAKPAATAAPAAPPIRIAWARTWSPALSLLVSNSRAGFLALPLSMATSGSQKATATATFRTNWVDSRALLDGPNIAQQGLSTQPAQFKLQIMHGSTPASHRGNCHIQGTTGHILAYGPNIDVADGWWHTITCIKYADTARGTMVVVIVDGVAGHAKWSHTPIGNIRPAGLVRLGGRSARAATDSLDGWIKRVSFKLG